MLARSLTQEELQLNQMKLKKLLTQTFLATLTHDNKIRPLYCLVKHELVLSSQKDDYH